MSRVWLYVSAIALASVAATYFAWHFDPIFGTARQPRWPDLAVFLALGVGLQLSEIRLAVGRASGSISFIVFIATALAFGPTWSALITALTIGVTQALNRRAWVKSVFNVAQHVLSLQVSILVYLALGGLIPPNSLDVVRVVFPFIALSLAFFFLNSGAVTIVVVLTEHRPVFDVWRRNTWNLIGYDIIASAFGLGIAWIYLRSGLISIAGLVVPILFLRHAYAVNLQLQAQNHELLELMVKAIEARDPYTSGHSLRVSLYAKALSLEAGLSARQTESIETAALLHDVGKIHEEYAPLLRKEGRLTKEEFEVMKKHPVRSYELVRTISRFRGAVELAVRHHHEDYDGRGYPDGLKAQLIPLGARIIRIADTTDAMTTDRPYRAAMTYDRVISELERYSGIQFDPGLVEAFKRSAALRALLNPARRSGGHLAILADKSLGIEGTPTMTGAFQQS